MNLKLPTLKKTEGGETTKPGAQKFLSDLYRDLSDRHLLLPLIALLVGIVAVPMLLSSSAEPTMPSTAPGAEGGDTSALDSAVIVSEPGIRNYRDRLSAMKEKNPFQATGGAASSGGDGGATGSGESGSQDSSSSSTSSGSPAPSTAPTGSSTSSSTSSSTGSASIDTGTGTTAPPADGADTSDEPSPDDVKPETRFYASRIDVAVGPVGNTKTIEGVKQLDFLPDQKTPVVAYLGLANDSHALFSVNPGVAEAQGEGHCAPRRSACMYLSLKVGEEQRFVYGDSEDAKIYRLKLLDARVVRIPDPRDREASAGENKTRPDAPVDASSRTE